MVRTSWNRNSGAASPPEGRVGSLKGEEGWRHGPGMHWAAVETAGRQGASANELTPFWAIADQSQARGVDAAGLIPLILLRS